MDSDPDLSPPSSATSDLGSSGSELFVGSPLYSGSLSGARQDDAEVSSSSFSPFMSSSIPTKSTSTQPIPPPLSTSLSTSSTRPALSVKSALRPSSVLDSLPSRLKKLHLRSSRGVRFAKSGESKEGEEEEEETDSDSDSRISSLQKLIPVPRTFSLRCDRRKSRGGSLLAPVAPVSASTSDAGVVSSSCSSSVTGMIPANLDIGHPRRRSAPASSTEGSDPDPNEARVDETRVFVRNTYLSPGFDQKRRGRRNHEVEEEEDDAYATPRFSSPPPGFLRRKRLERERKRKKKHAKVRKVHDDDEGEGERKRRCSSSSPPPPSSSSEKTDVLQQAKRRKRKSRTKKKSKRPRSAVRSREERRKMRRKRARARGRGRRRRDRGGSRGRRRSPSKVRSTFRKVKEGAALQLQLETALLNEEEDECEATVEVEEGEKEGTCRRESQASCRVMTQETETPPPPLPSSQGNIVEIVSPLPPPPIEYREFGPIAVLLDERSAIENLVERDLRAYGVKRFLVEQLSEMSDRNKENGKRIAELEEQLAARTTEADLWKKKYVQEVETLRHQSQELKLQLEETQSENAELVSSLRAEALATPAPVSLSLPQLQRDENELLPVAMLRRQLVENPINKALRAVDALRREMDVTRSEFIRTRDQLMECMAACLQGIEEVVTARQVCYSRVQLQVVRDLGLFKMYPSGRLRPLKEGMLRRKLFLCGWKPVFVVVSQLANSLSLFDDVTSEILLRRMCLQGGSVVVRASSFVVRTPVGSLTLTAEDERECGEWVAFLRVLFHLQKS